MKTLHVINHTSSEYLGLMEDHLEGRGIRFRYFRPFTEGTPLPATGVTVDGLVLLGGGPWAATGPHALPSLDAEVAIARNYLMAAKPVLGIGLGSQILALAADGGVEGADLNFHVSRLRRSESDALNGFMPEHIPQVVYMRGRAVPPQFATILAADEMGRPGIFQLGENCFGFAGHPGFKRAMAEDLIMEFAEAPLNPLAVLDEVSANQAEIEDCLVPLMTGLVQKTGWMG
jgi:GMP synthase-like glutamine amidotransferase